MYPIVAGLAASSLVTTHLRGRSATSALLLNQRHIIRKVAR